jgi:hypothetical protein
MKNRGKSKGSEFERMVAKLLDVWWEVPKGTFWRSKISGGADEPGDITPRFSTELKEWPFVIECKHYKEVKLIQLLSSSSLKDGGQILQWWQQLSKDHQKALTKKPNTLLYRLLFMKGTNTPLLVGFRPMDFNTSPKIDLKFIDIFSRIPDILIFSRCSYSTSLAICTWENFSNTITKSIILNMKSKNEN